MKKTGIGLIVLAVLGAGCYLFQLIYGAQLTNLHNALPWGLYVVGYMLFTGIAAGVLLFLGTCWLIERLDAYRPYTGWLTWVGVFGGLIGAGLFIFVDMGSPQRGIYMMLSPNLTSPQVWDAAILGLYGLTGALLLWQCHEIRAGKRQGISKSLAGLAIIDGFLVIVTAFVLSLQVAAPLWNHSSVPISFLTSAILAALSVMVLLFRHPGVIQEAGPVNSLLKPLGLLMAAMIIVELLFVLSDIAIGLYAPQGEEGKIMVWLMQGKGAPFFWTEMGLLLLALLGSLFERYRGWGAVLSLLAVILVKYNLLLAQHLNPLLPTAGPSYASPLVQVVYLPSMLEAGTAAGIVAAVCLTGYYGMRLLEDRI